MYIYVLFGRGSVNVPVLFMLCVVVRGVWRCVWRGVCVIDVAGWCGAGPVLGDTSPHPDTHLHRHVVLYSVT